ncbi:MAG TPA: MBOAT family protein, partial [Porphyromonadaceae bacterium]|nr:MBOAT family protein [Porphyromonadaceae bacterium]
DVCKHRRSSHLAKNIVLIAFSLIFYAWGEPVYVFLMLASVLLNYCVGRGIGHCDGKGRRLWLVLGVVANLSVLGTFKYLNFFSQILRDMGLDVADPHIALPIGISFYIFQSISYLVDVYRRESPVQKSFFGLLLYISMFPQLIAGPIVRYNTVADEIDNRRVSAADIADGVFRFMIGLGKKVILANQLGEVATQLIGGDMQQTTVAGAWIGIGAFMLQIYFDFSGYSDMAIGIGRCLGFHFCENFDHPYCSRTITEFWRRWHISLGSFFRDYVYI